MSDNMDGLITQMKKHMRLDAEREFWLGKLCGYLDLLEKEVLSGDDTAAAVTQPPPEVKPQDAAEQEREVEKQVANGPCSFREISEMCDITEQLLAIVVTSNPGDSHVRPLVGELFLKLERYLGHKRPEPRRKAEQVVREMQQEAISRRGRRVLPGGRFQVLDLLFSAFQEQPYYNTRDLIKIARQPLSLLREILAEICRFRKKSPHRNMWELKQEYRRYLESDDEDEDQGPNPAAMKPLRAA